MATLPIKTRAQQSSPGKLVDLFRIDLSRLGGGLLYFTPQVYEDQSQVMFDGIMYSAIPIEVSGFERSTKDPFPHPRVKISNVNLVASALVRDYRDLVGATVTHIQTFANYLDDGDDPDPGQYFPPNVYRIERKVAQTALAIEWELAVAIDQQNRKLPGRQVLRICTWIYRRPDPEVSGEFLYEQSDRACPYTGAACFDRNNVPTDAAHDHCSHTVTGCKARFGQFAELPYGGFPGVGLSA